MDSQTVFDGELPHFGFRDSGLGKGSVDAAFLGCLDSGAEIVQIVGI